jgi:3-hydroxyacyl-CoA dehydrogenase
MEPLTELTTIAVIGANLLGRDIACVAALSGYKTIYEDVSCDVLDRAVNWIKQTIEQTTRVDRS